MPAARTHNARATALALAMGVNGLLLVLLMSSHGRAPAPQQTITAMIWIDPPEPPPPRQPPAARTLPRSTVPVANSAGLAPPPPTAAPPVQQFPPDTTIDLPQIDWSEAAAAAVREQLRKEEELAMRSRSLNSMPEVLVLPGDRGYEKGHVERLEGGVTMTFDGDCVTTSDPQAMQPWALDPVGKFFGAPASARWFSKGGGCRADQDSRKRAQALERAVKPRYLGGTRPLPEEDKSTSGIKIP